VDSAARADNDGLSASLSVNFNVSGRSTLRAVLLQDITNTSSLFLGTAIDPATGNIINIQTSGEVVRNRSMRVKYARKGTMINTDIWTELRELDYSSATSDRDVQEVGASLGYPVTPLMNASLSGRYTRNDLQATAVVQKEFSVAAGLGYQFSRRVGLNFAVKHNSRNSTVAADEFDEFSVSANVGYKFWP
jgi:predicted porin